VNKFKDTDQRGELRDLFAMAAMHKLIDGNATPTWVANRAYEYADIMLVQRDTVSHNNNNKETLINE
jgi:hypothetical protein